MTRAVRHTLWLVSLGVALSAGGLLAAAPAASKTKAKAKPAAAEASAGSKHPAFKPDQQVEVREGDEWSPATVQTREGRKYQIRYEDGTEEWVSTERLRVPGTEGKPAGAPSGKRDTAGAKPAVKKARKEQFAIGAKVEVQNHDRWEKASVKNRDGDLYLIATDFLPQEFHWQWVHVSSVRKPGSSKRGVSSVKSVGVHNQGIAKAKAEAKRVFENIEEELATDATRPPKGVSPFEPKPYDKPVSDVNIDKVEDLVPGGAPGKLAKFDPLPAKPLKLSSKSITLKGMGEWPSERPTDLLLGGKRALVPYYSSRASDMRTLRIEVLDLAGGRNLGFVKADPLSKPVAVSPSGRRIAGIQHGFHSGTKSRLDVFDLSADGAGAPKHLISFMPYSSADYHWKDVDWAVFADDDHLLTGTWVGDAICWHAPTATARWRLKVNGRPALSPGGKQVAVSTPTGVLVIDAAAGKVLCATEGGPALTGLSFSPDGKRLVGLGNRSVGGWDLAAGKALPEIGLPAGAAGGSALALDSRFVLVGGSDLVDLDKKLVVWRYVGLGLGHNAAALAAGGRCWAILPAGRGGAVLASAALPHAAAVKAADAAAPGHGLLVKPGDAIALSIGIEGTPEQQQKITAAITAQLQAQDLRVDAAAPVKLIARTETGKTTEQEYERREFGVPPGFRQSEKVSVTEKITRIFFEHNGKVAWESRTSSGVPMFVQGKEGQTIGQAVQAASTFNLAFLESVRVPAYVPSPSDKPPGFGQSAWTASGIGNDQPNPAAPAAAPSN